MNEAKPGVLPERVHRSGQKHLVHAGLPNTGDDDTHEVYPLYQWDTENAVKRQVSSRGQK